MEFIAVEVQGEYVLMHQDRRPLFVELMAGSQYLRVKIEVAATTNEDVAMTSVVQKFEVERFIMVE